MAEETGDEYYRRRFNTKLTPDEEKQYREWVAEQSKKAERDVSQDEIDYDMRGAWKAGAAQADDGHFPDTYKKPNHPTFSEESQYHGVKDDRGRQHQGGRWEYDADGKPVAFEQGPTNAEHWPEWAIKDYLQRAEPGVALKKKTGGK